MMMAARTQQILLEEVTNQHKSLLRTKEIPVTREITKNNGISSESKCEKKHQKLVKAPLDSY